MNGCCTYVLTGIVFVYVSETRCPGRRVDLKGSPVFREEGWRTGTIMNVLVSD